MVNEEVPLIVDSSVKKSILKGTMKIIPSKRLTDPRENVTFLVLHLRLKNHDADVVLALHVPQKSDIEKLESDIGTKICV